MLDKCHTDTNLSSEEWQSIIFKFDNLYIHFLFDQSSDLISEEKHEKKFSICRDKNKKLLNFDWQFSAEQLSRLIPSIKTGPCALSQSFTKRLKENIQTRKPDNLTPSLPVHYSSKIIFLFIWLRHRCQIHNKI